MPIFGQRNESTNLTDEQAVERYRYMLRTAPPEMIEKAHEEAFAKLTPEQRRLALQQLTAAAPPEEAQRASEDPRSLARLATRTELRQPGMLERLFGSGSIGRGYGSGIGGAGSGFGSMLAGSLLGSIAGTFIGSAIAESFFHDHPFGSDVANTHGFFGADENMHDDLSADTSDAGFEDGGDFGGDVDI
jgi:hypothetical protein